MPGQQDFIQIIDATLTKSEIQQTILALQPLKEEIKAFSGISIFTKNTQGAQEFRQQAVQLEEAVKRIKALESDLDTMRAKHATSNKVRTDEEIADSQKKAQATRGRVAEIRSEEDAYKKLTNEYNKAASAAKILGAQYGVHSKEARNAAKAAGELSEKLQQVNKAAGDSRSAVGKYTEGIKDFAKEMINMLGPIYLAEKAFDFLKDSVKSFMAAEDSAVRLKNVLSNMGRSGDLEGLDRAASKLAESLGTVAKKDVEETFQKLYLYGKLSKGQILELTPVIADFAAKQRIDLPEATDVLTKALEGNSRGLKNYGINIKDGKDATERFAIIMDQLKPKVDGAAEALGGELAGSIKKTDIAIEELKVKIGEELAPELKKAERFLLAFVQRIPEWFNSADEAIGRLKAKVSAFFGFDDLQKEFDDYDMLKKQKKEYADQLERIDNLKENFGKKSKPDQDREIAYLEKAFKLEYDRVQLLLKKGDIAGAQAPAEAASELKQELDAYRDVQNSFSGPVNPDAHIQSAEQIAAEKAKLAKILAARLEAAIEYQKILADEASNTIASRTAAFKKIEELESQQILSEQDQMRNRVDQIGRLAAIRFAALNDDKILSAQNAKDLEDISRTHEKAMLDIQKQALASQKAYLMDAANVEHAANDKDFLSGKIDAKTYQKKKSGIDYNSSKALLTDASTNADKMLSANPNDPSLQQAASQARMQLFDLEVQHKMDKEAELEAQKKKASELEVQAAHAVGNAVKSFVEGAYERQLNSIQKQIDKNNELKEKETSSIRNSTLSLQEKASAQILLDAQVNASNEALHRRQRDLKVKEAQFDRAASILQITEQAAIAAIAALKIPIYGEAEAIAIGVIAAAQIASILAKPIPTYATGTGNHPGGPMIVGEEGPEMRIDPSGKVTMTPGVPTLTYGKRGTKIIPADEVNRMMLADMMKMTVAQDKANRSEELLEALVEASQYQLAAMRKKQPIHNHIHIHSSFEAHINNSVRN